VGVNKDDGRNQNTVEEKESTGSTFTKQTNTLDISGLSGSYYVRIHVYKYNLNIGDPEVLRAYNIWLE